MPSIGSNELQPKFFFKANESGVDAVLHFQALVLNFEKEILLAEDVRISCRSLPCCVVLVLDEILGDFTFQTPGERNQSFSMLGQKILADSWLVVEAVQGRLGGDFYQIAIALFVFGEH